MWTETTRAQHKRDELRFASDLSDAEWAVLQPLLPPASAVGRPPSWPMRDIVDAIFYVLRGGVPAGACCRIAFRLGRRSTLGSPGGAIAGCGR